MSLLLLRDSTHYDHGQNNCVGQMAFCLTKHVAETVLSETFFIRGTKWESCRITEICRKTENRVTLVSLCSKSGFGNPKSKWDWGPVSTHDNRVLKGPLGRSLRSFARTAHSAHSLRSALLCYARFARSLRSQAHSLTSRTPSRTVEIHEYVFALKTQYTGTIEILVVSRNRPLVRRIYTILRVDEDEWGGYDVVTIMSKWFCSILSLYLGRAFTQSGTLQT